MRYTVHLFALDAESFAVRLSDETDQLLEAMREHWTSQSKVARKDLQLGLRLAREFCRGEMASPSTLDQLWAIYRLLDSTAERIPLPMLEGVNRLSFVEEVGLPTVMELQAPPFAVPKFDGAAAIGYLSRDQLQDAMSILNGLGPGESGVMAARQCFVEVLNSLHEDDLDLVILIAG